MHNKFFYLQLLIFLFCSSFVLCRTGASGSDTIYVYEEVIIYDSIYIYDTIWAVDPNINMLPAEPIDIKSLKTNFILDYENLLNSGKKSATISDNGIIHNKNSKSMKKINLFGMVLLASHAMAISQTHLGLSVGSGMWWANYKNAEIDRGISSAFGTGIYLEHSIDTNFYLKTGLYFSVLMFESQDLVNVYNLVRISATTPISEIMIPLQIGYNAGKVKPFIGLDFAYRTSNLSVINAVGIFGGLNFTLSRRLSLGVCYYNDLVVDYDKAAEINVMQIVSVGGGDTDEYTRSGRLELSLSYSFIRKRKHK